jgi:hypothetical protein
MGAAGAGAGGAADGGATTGGGAAGGGGGGGGAGLRVGGVLLSRSASAAIAAACLNKDRAWVLTGRRDKVLTTSSINLTRASPNLLRSSRTPERRVPSEAKARWRSSSARLARSSALTRPAYHDGGRGRSRSFPRMDARPTER